MHSSGGEKPRRSSNWRVLRHREFRFYFFGSLISNTGTWLQNTTQVLLAYQLTRSVFAVGLVVSAQFGGTLVVSPWAAVLADRIGSKTTLVGAQCFSAFVAGAMAWRYHYDMLGEHSLIVGALGLGLAFSLALPVQTALVPTLTAPQETQAALAINSVSYNTGRALAPALCIPVIAFVGPDLIFALNASSFALFAVILARLGGGPSAEALSWLPRNHGNDPLKRVRLADGLRIARGYRRLLLLLAIVAAVTLADDPVQVLSPSLAHAFHMPVAWAGYFIAALGWGTVLGSMAPGRSRNCIGSPRASRRAAWSLLALAVSMIVFTAGFTAWVSLLAAFAAGAAALFTGAATQALMVRRYQTVTASVTGLWAIAWAGTKPVASLLDGWFASHFGILITGIILACPAMLLALGEIALPVKARKRIKKWSLTKYLESDPPLSRVLSSLSGRFVWDRVAEEGRGTATTAVTDGYGRS